MTDYLTDAFYARMRDELETRVSPERFAHSLSVAKMSEQLAALYGVDKREARLAGILHDWDKGYCNQDIVARAREYKVNAPEIVFELMPRVLHGQTAAHAIAERYQDMLPEILQAVERHTTAAVDMSALDMIIYVADALEPLRSFNGLEEIRAKIGKVSLEELFFVTFTDIFMSLLKQKKTVNPMTVDAWNYYVQRNREKTDEKGTA